MRQTRKVLAAIDAAMAFLAAVQNFVRQLPASRDKEARRRFREDYAPTRLIA